MVRFNNLRSGWKTSRFGMMARLALWVSLFATLVACNDTSETTAGEARYVPTPFTLAVIPDTQNMLDFTHQKNELTPSGRRFPIDAAEQFIGMMRYIAANSVGNGGDIVFVAAVGDVWQHQSIIIDEDHASRGFEHLPSTPLAMSGEVFTTGKTRTVEMPKAAEGYRLLAEVGLPFGVAPGNHDYDAMWSDARFPGDAGRLGEKDVFVPEILGMLHVGGLDNFNAVFGDDSRFFRDKPWYISSFNGGANAAQVFTAGGYTFLHITLEMHAPNKALNWAQLVINANPGLPTIITTHDYLNVFGQRTANPLIDLARLDPNHHNSAEQVFEKLISPNDQIFLVLCGHHHGQALRIDENAKGHAVYQVLADYQDRGQTVLDHNPKIRDGHNRPYGIGDGWLRLMTFDTGQAVPTVTVTTYSSHYDILSDDLETYAYWYREREQPRMTEEEFHAADSFTLKLEDFRKRFGDPSAPEIAGDHPQRPDQTDNK